MRLKSAFWLAASIAILAILPAIVLGWDNCFRGQCNSCNIVIDQIGFDRSYYNSDYNTFCMKDYLRVSADVSVNSGCRSEVTFNLYIDDNYFDSKTLNVDSGLTTVVFDRLVYSSNFIAMRHSVKVTAISSCNSEIASSTQYFWVQDCDHNQVCVPGETRNMRTTYGDHVWYERCNVDGNGWYAVSTICGDGQLYQDGVCGYRGKYSLDVTVSTPGNVNTGDLVSSTITLANTGDFAVNAQGDAMICKNGDSCYKMQCYNSYTDPMFLVPRGITTNVKCQATIGNEGSYYIKLNYKVNGEARTAYSASFFVLKNAGCASQYTGTYRCSPDGWRQQLYQNSDCSDTWVNLEKCDYGCSNDFECMPNPASTGNSSVGQQDGKIWGSGYAALQEGSLLIVIILGIILVAILVFMLLNNYWDRRYRCNEPESF